MGYETVYNLNPNTEAPSILDIASFLAQTVDQSAPGSPKHDTDVNYWQSVLEGAAPTTWYHYRANMVQVSRHWPKVLFELHGDGEEKDDQWKEYFRQGKVQRIEPTITWPEFDETQLSEPEEVPPYLKPD